MKYMFTLQYFPKMYFTTNGHKIMNTDKVMFAIKIAVRNKMKWKNGALLYMWRNKN